LEGNVGKGKDSGRRKPGREGDDPWNALKLTDKGPVVSKK
jgi:hypothetical protein